MGGAPVSQRVELCRLVMPIISAKKSNVCQTILDNTCKNGGTYSCDMIDILGCGLEFGGLNFTGSRLLSLSKNSDVFLAGVDGIKTSDLRSRKPL